jgi:2-polyprenyl-3-methyl-5-hydroxy-6-metoxy-1,4-benzoquinol methylase
MNILPWRVRNAISNHFPLAYHLAANLFRRRSGAEYWDNNLAQGWNSDVRRWAAKAQIIARHTRPDAALIDIGCGNGSILRDLRELGLSNLSGLEISEYAVKRLREEGFRMYQGKLPEISAPSASFDVVIASQVLEHIIRRGTFAREMSRIMKPGAQGFIFVPNDCLGPIDEPEHVIKYDKDSLTAFLRRHFEILSVEAFNDPNYPMSILLGHVRKTSVVGA